MVIEGRTAGLWTRRLIKHERAHSVARTEELPVRQYINYYIKESGGGGGLAAA